MSIILMFAGFIIWMTACTLLPVMIHEKILKREMKDFQIWWMGASFTIGVMLWSLLGNLL